MIIIKIIIKIIIIIIKIKNNNNNNSVIDGWVLWWFLEEFRWVFVLFWKFNAFFTIAFSELIGATQMIRSSVV